MEAAMKYRSDYLGRMQEITYPDGEVVTYGYDYGGQITSVKGMRRGTAFNYVKEIGYDEYGQRVNIKYGTDIETNYTYDPYRRWLKNIKTNKGSLVYQDINYTFDAVGNVRGYENNSFNHTTSQKYDYDDLYQLITASGNSRSHQNVGATDYTTTYKQDFNFDKIGNMTSKTSTSHVSTGTRIGADLNYNLEYKYYKGTHKAEVIGERYYNYDLNGNLVAERDGSHAKDTEVYRSYHKDGEIYYAEYGFGFARPQGVQQDDGVYQRNYRWNERNLLRESSDSVYTVQYRYGSDGQRAIKYVMNNQSTTLYYNNMWQESNSTKDWMVSKHVYVGEDRIATKNNYKANDNTMAEERRTYYYHSDHLGSAQTVTNHDGLIHERIEYTPYGELWIDWKNPNLPGDNTPFRFTGKEMDAETGLYYYGARYLDPKTSRWLSGDPAMYQGDYLPSAPVDDEARKRNGNLPGQGGVYNYVNLHVYHYAGNNPVKYVDPDGNETKKSQLISGIIQMAGGTGIWVVAIAGAPESFGATMFMCVWGTKEFADGLAKISTAFAGMDYDGAIPEIAGFLGANDQTKAIVGAVESAIGTRVDAGKIGKALTALGVADSVAEMVNTFLTSSNGGTTSNSSSGGPDYLVRNNKVRDVFARHVISSALNTNPTHNDRLNSYSTRKWLLNEIDELINITPGRNMRNDLIKMQNALNEMN